MHFLCCSYTITPCIKLPHYIKKVYIISKKSIWGIDISRYLV
nr:MAG TPA: hypothetical protein [Caudoviricetes sp.]